MKLIQFTFVFLLAGCIPLNETKRPELELTVSDEKGKPISEAKVKLLKVTCGMGRCGPSVTDHVTDSDGHLSLEAIKRRAVLVLVGPDIGGSKKWSLCVNKEGYSPFIEKSVGSWFGNNVFNVKLEKSSSNQKCLLDNENLSFKTDEL